VRILGAVVGAVVVLLLGGAVVLGFLAPPDLLAPTERGASFVDVTVVNPGATRVPGRTVTVVESRIASIEATVDGDDGEGGGFVLPGLVDMHVHDADGSIDGQQELFSLLYLAHGVTTVRNTGGGIAQLDWRARVDRGEVAGPRVFACGPLYDGDPPIWAFSIVVKTPEEVPENLRQHLEIGYDCLKVYERLEPPVLAALVEGAHEQGLRVVGHVPDRVPFEAAGIDDVQHLRGVEREGAEEPTLDPVERVRRRGARWAALTPERIDFVVSTAFAQGVAFTPTLVLFDRSTRFDRVDEMLRDPLLELLPRFYGELTWDPRGVPSFEQFGPADWEAARRVEANAKRLVAALFRAGVRIHAGTDVGNPFLVPGASLQEELRHLVDAGLSPEEAWLTATRWPGEFLGEPGLGVVEPGAPADLLLFREDPTRDLDALATLEAVVADGRLYRREELDAALERARSHYRGWLYDRVSMAIGTRRRTDALRAMREAAESAATP
jgi:cytosine/adenosine deaminase-related metal-dependent hydrolase